MKTIITASVSRKTADLLQDVTKGNRSNVVDRAVKEYLTTQRAFTINDLPRKRIAMVLMGRLQEENNWQHTPLTLALRNLIDSLDDDLI